MFKPLSHGPSKQVYSDGALYHNNPIQIADKERKLIWPSLANNPPDIIVSIGTTYNSASGLSTQRKIIPRSGLLAHGKLLYTIATDHIASALDSEKAWHSYLNVLQPPPSQRYRYVRINPQLNNDPPRMDDVSRLTFIQEEARKIVQSDDKIQKLADQLIASSFYFENYHSGEVMYKGSVRCKGMRIRLPEIMC